MSLVNSVKKYLLLHLTIGLLVWIATINKTDAQTNDTLHRSATVAGFDLHTGIILKNYPVFPPRSMAFLGQFNLGKQTFGYKSWQSDMIFPETGLSVVAGILGNQHALGNVIALLPYLGWRINHSTSWELNLRIGMGFAWFTNPYNEINNRENTLMGSSLANMTQIAVIAGVPLNDKLHFETGFSFVHFSNGHTRLPNLGINMPCLFAGIKLKPDKVNNTNRYKHPDTLPDRYQMVVELLGGMHEFGESTEPTGGISYPVYGFGLGIRWLPSRLHTFTASVEYNYYSSFYDFTVLNHLTDHQEWFYASTIIIYTGHEFILGHLGLDTRIGFYLHNPFRKDYEAKILQIDEGAKLINSNKLGFNWYLFDPTVASWNLRIGIYIKANLGQADYTGAGLSLIF